MTSRTRREFTEEFKREAVLLLESSGRPLMQVAKEFGIQPSMLRNWRARGHGPAGLAAERAGTGKVTLPASPEQAEIRQLRKELDRAQTERDILKRAMVGSTGGRNSVCECSTWGFVAQCFPRSGIELECDGVEFVLGMNG